MLWGERGGGVPVCPGVLLVQQALLPVPQGRPQFDLALDLPQVRGGLRGALRGQVPAVFLEELRGVGAGQEVLDQVGDDAGGSTVGSGGASR